MTHRYDEGIAELVSAAQSDVRAPSSLVHTFAQLGTLGEEAFAAAFAAVRGYQGPNREMYYELLDQLHVQAALQRAGEEIGATARNMSFCYQQLRLSDSAADSVDEQRNSVTGALRDALDAVYACKDAFSKRLREFAQLRREQIADMNRIAALHHSECACGRAAIDLQRVVAEREAVVAKITQFSATVQQHLNTTPAELHTQLQQLEQELTRIETCLDTAERRAAEQRTHRIEL